MKCALRNKITFVLVLLGIACFSHLEVVGSVEIDGATLSTKGTETAVDAPVAKDATEIGATSFQANWTAVKGVDGYKLYVYKVGRGQVKTYITGYNPKAVAGATTIKTRVSGLNLATTYYFVLKAVVGKTESVLSNVISLKTSDIPDAPLATAATDIGATSFQANWEVSGGATGYKLTVYNNFLHEYVQGLTGIISGGSVDSFSVTGLAPDISYSYYVKAVNDIGTSGISNWINLKTLTLKSLILSANPAEGGIVSGGETVGAGSPVTASATANEGYIFMNWTQNGTEVSSNASYTFNLDENAELVANFSLLPPDAPEIYGTSQVQDSSFWAEWRDVENVSEYKLTVYSINSSGDKVYLSDYNPKTITGFKGTYVKGLEPSTTYYWSVQATNSGGDSEPSDLQVVNTRRASPVLNPVTDITSSSCKVSWSSLEGALEYHLWVYINNGVYLEGYEPKSVADTSFLVEGLSPNSTYSISVLAVFLDGETVKSKYQSMTTLAINSLSLSASLEAGGSISGAGTFDNGAEVSAQAIANGGYVFVNWTEGGTEVSTNTEYTFVLNESRTLVANFSAVVTTNTLTLSASPVEGGTVSGGTTVNTGTSATAQATANEGYVFVNWTENGTEVSTDANYTFSLSENRTLVANFSAVVITNTLSMSVSPAEGGTVNGGTTVNTGTSVTAQATVNDGYVFVNWTEAGLEVSTNAAYTFTLNEDRTLVANFSAVVITNTLSLSVSPAEGGTVIGDTTVNTGTWVTAKAIANEGYVFVNWTEEGTEVSTDAAYTFILNEDRTLVANFAVVVSTNTLSLSASPTEGGTVSGVTTVNTGTSVTAQATVNDGYVFVNWTEGGTEVSTNTEYTFALNEDRNLVANFRLSTDIDDDLMAYVTVYPNPISSLLHISEIPNRSSIKITSLIGHLVFHKNDCNSIELLNLGFLNSGIYILRVENEEKRYTQKIIKR